MARKKQSPFEDLIEFASLLPWWAGLILAVISFIVLSQIANTETQTMDGVSQIGQYASQQLYIVFAKIGQIFLPFAFTVGAIISAIKQRKRSNLFSSVEILEPDNHFGSNRVGVNAISNMSWQEFEMVVSEFFRKQGYSVLESGGGGPDGGVDLRLKKDNKKIIVQCKHWKTSKVGVQVVREQLGIKTAEAADGVIIVTSGLYTNDAIKFANEQDIILIDGEKLKEIITKTKRSLPIDLKRTTVTTSTPIASIAPICPRCSSPMVKRTAKKGKLAGNKFWGCSRFPQCRGIINQ